MSCGGGLGGLASIGYMLYYCSIMAQELKAKRGRPKIVPSDLGDDWAERIINLMKVGGSKVEVCAELDIDNETFDRLVREEPDFSATVKRALQLSEAWWVRNGREGLREKEFNYTGWYMNMKNRFGWKDKSETDITSKGEQIGVQLSDAQYQQIVAARARRADT